MGAVARACCSLGTDAVDLGLRPTGATCALSAPATCSAYLNKGGGRVKVCAECVEGTSHEGYAT